MNRGQFNDPSRNYPGVKRLWFKWTMTAATTFVINRAAEFLAGTAAIVRTGTGVFDLFPEGPPGVGLMNWSVNTILATESNVALGGTGKTSLVNNLVASSKLTLTFRRADTLAATDLANTDIVHGYFDIMTVSV